MRRIAIGIAVAVVGVFVSWAGQGIWRASPDALWGAVGVVSVLSGITIGSQPMIARAMSSIIPPRFSSVPEQSRPQGMP